MLSVYKLIGLKKVFKHYEDKLLRLTAFNEKGTFCASESSATDRNFYETSDWVESVKIKFESKLFNVPKGYHNVLKTNFGDYMQLPPEDQRHSHEYYEMYWR